MNENNANIGIRGLRVTAFVPQVKYSDELRDSLLTALPSFTPFARVLREPKDKSHLDPNDVLYFGFENKKSEIKYTFNAQTIDLEVNTQFLYSLERFHSPVQSMAGILKALLQVCNVATNRLALAIILDKELDISEIHEYMSSRISVSKFKGKTVSHSNFAVSYLINEKFAERDVPVNYYVSCTNGKKLIEVKDYHEEKDVLLFDFDINTTFTHPALSIDFISEFFDKMPEKVDSYIKFIVSKHE